MSATDIQSCHSNEPISMREPQLFTTGAKAMSGTVWLSTIHGSRPHSARRQRCITSARPMPTTTPTSQPTAAMPSVVRAASATTAQSGGADGERVTGSTSRPTMSQTCGIARSVVRGSTRAPPITTPSAGPRSLYTSQISATARMPARPQPSA